MTSNNPDFSQRQLPADSNITGRRFDDTELANLKQVLESGTLNCTKGTWVKRFEQAFAEMYGMPYARCTTSGTAAIHTAISAINPEPGDEIITTPITDMGGITPIMYQTAIPRFVDIDPNTFNVTAETIEPHINSRTKAIIVTHLFGNPCDMQAIMQLANKHNIPVIEDTAQAFLAKYDGKYVGTIGDIGAFSLQQGKHMTTGEGGIVVARDSKLQHHMTLFTDKAWDYANSPSDHYFIALNYRMTELQGAVALAQLDKLQSVVASRQTTAQQLSELIDGLDGIQLPVVTPNSEHVYWKYCVKIDPNLIQGGVDEFAKQLKQRGIFAAPRYIQKPAFMCKVIKDQVTFGNSSFPFKGPHMQNREAVVNKPEDFPGTYDVLSKICVIPWNENYSEQDVEFIANAILETHKTLRK